MNTLYSYIVTLALLMSASIKSAEGPVVQLASQLAVQAVAECSLAASSQGPAKVFCLEADVQTGAAECFSDPERAWNDGRERIYKSGLGVGNRNRFAEYEKNKESLIGLLANMIFSAPKVAPDIACTPLNGKPVPSELVCSGITDRASAKQLCFEKPLYCHSSRHPREESTVCFNDRAGMTEYAILQRRQELSAWEHFLADQQGRLTACGQKGETVSEMDICPKDGESVDAYLARMFSVVNDGSYNHGPMRIEDFLSDRSPLWVVPWQTQRYPLACMITLKQVDPNVVFSIANATPLDLAAEHNDEEMMFWLWDKGACTTQHADNFEHIKKSMLYSSDRRSLAVLRDMYDKGVNFDLKYTDWATDLEPELVERKVDIIYFNRIRFKYVGAFPENTPGLKALKKRAESHTTEQGCVIS